MSYDIQIYIGTYVRT